MRLKYFFVFLTLVLSFPGKTAPNIEVKPSDSGASVESKSSTSTSSADLKNSLSTTEPPAMPERIPPLKQKLFDHVLQFKTGYFTGFHVRNSETFTQNLYWGLQNVNYNSNGTAQEYGFYVYDNSILSLHVGFKWLCCQGELYEPYYKVGVIGFYETPKGFANLVDYNRYAVQMSVGLEDLFKSYRKLGLEFSFAYGLMGPSAQVSLSWAIPY